jgi:hypothetical protein
MPWSHPFSTPNSLCWLSYGSSFYCISPRPGAARPLVRSKNWNAPIHRKTLCPAICRVFGGRFDRFSLAVLLTSGTTFAQSSSRQQTLDAHAKTGEEPNMVTRILVMLVALGVLSTVHGCYYVEPPPPAPPAYGRYGGPSPGAYREDERRMKEDEQREYWQQRRRERAYWDRQTAPGGPPPAIPPPPPGPPPPPPPDLVR